MKEPACWSWPLPDDLLADPVEALQAWQAGRCAMCGEEGKTLVRDHDHGTGQIRGLLCVSDNVREGKGRPDFAAWRARPATAVLGLNIVYGPIEPAGTKILHVLLPVDVHARLSVYGRRTRRGMTNSAIVLLERALDGEQDATGARM